MTTISGVFFDVETGGLQSHQDALLEVAAQPFKIHTLAKGGSRWEFLPHFHAHIVPTPCLHISGAALKVQGKVWADVPHKGAISEQEAWEGLLSHLKEHGGHGADIWSIPMWAHNSQFDNGFLKAWQDRAATEGHIFFDRNSMACTREMAKILQATGRLKHGISTSLRMLAIKFKMECDENAAHDALTDARLGVGVLANLLELEAQGA